MIDVSRVTLAKQMIRVSRCAALQLQHNGVKPALDRISGTAFLVSILVSVASAQVGSQDA
jgi:hypothetical protein